MTERLFKPKTKNLQKVAWISGGCVVLLLIIYALLPRPERPANRTQISLEDARLAARWLMLAASKPSPASPQEVALGKALFHDKKLSPAGNQSCADCHAATSDEDGKAFHPLSDLHTVHWFFADGREPSLVGAVLESLESDRFLASNRLHVAHQIQERYSGAYQSLYGNLPKGLKKLPPAGYPLRQPPQPLSMELGGKALETLRHRETLEDILVVSRESHGVPSLELSRRALDLGPQSEEWILEFRKLTPQEQSQVTNVFANAGQAIARYLETKRSEPSPFDRFAASIQTSASLEAALNDDFSGEALAGFAFFAGEGGCIRCHNGPMLTDQQFHNIGLAATNPGVTLGRTAGIARYFASPYNCQNAPFRKDITHQESCREAPFLPKDEPAFLGAFRTPSLRRSVQHRTFMHDGQFTTLQQVLHHYSTLPTQPAVGITSPLLSPLKLSEEESQALEAFLMTLSAKPTVLQKQHDGP